MKKYAADYQKSGDGYAYSGTRHEVPVPVEELRQKAGADLVRMAAASLFFLLGVFQNNEGTRTLWILLPFVGTFLAIAYGWMSAWSLLVYAGGEQGKAGWMRQSDYDHGIRRPVRCGIWLSVLGLVSFLGEAGLLLFGAASWREEAVLLGAAAGISAVGIIYCRRSRKLKQKVL